MYIIFYLLILVIYSILNIQKVGCFVVMWALFYFSDCDNWIIPQTIAKWQVYLKWLISYSIVYTESVHFVEAIWNDFIYAVLLIYSN